ncbi:hypothetical protein RB195_024662 [Necator americanus]|uniref:Uncharacterized protein n=1 Tax=Necator americanus TaxID=51031 RepID=A0ABR1EP45_NECAM
MSELDAFYEELEEVIRNEKSIYKFVVDNFNAKLREATKEEYRNGRFGLGDRNENDNQAHIDTAKHLEAMPYREFGDASLTPNHVDVPSCLRCRPAQLKFVEKNLNHFSSNTYLLRRPVFTGHVGPSISSTRFVPSPLSSKMFSSFVSDVDEVLEPYLAELSAGPSV